MKSRSIFHSVFSMLMIAASMLVFTNCSSDDDDDNNGSDNGGKTTLTTPQYEDVSAYYEIVSSSSSIKSIELTSSGNYIVIKNNYSKIAQHTLTFSKFITAPDEAATRSTTYDNIIKGSFTKISDTEFELEGFGRIVINGSTSSAVSLEITPTGGQTYTLEAAKKNQNPNSQTTNWLCRTWDFEQFQMKIVMSFNGKSVTIINGKYKMTDEKKFRKDIVAGMKKAFQTFYPTEYKQQQSEADAYAEEAANSIQFNNENRPVQVIFTKAGTYMVLYEGNRLAVSTWAWENESKGVLRYSWDYSNMGKDPGDWSTYYGLAEVGFYGNQLTLKESVSQDVEDYGTEVELTWYMTEAK